MKILVTGANGFIGRHLANALLEDGHQVLYGVRRQPLTLRPGCEYIEMDFTRDFAPEVWLERLRDVDVVINTVGIIRQHGNQTFDALHIRAPVALFTACKQAGVKLVIQFSALGADEGAKSRYHLSKKAADDFLKKLDIHSVILQPSLVFGTEGASTRLFTQIASMPLILLPNAGRQMVQPVHISDIEALVQALVSDPLAGRVISSLVIPVVGPRPVSFATYLSILRHGMGMHAKRIHALSNWLLGLATSLTSYLPQSPLDRESLDMLERGNAGDASIITGYLGREPKPPADFLSEKDSEYLRTQALLGWLLPMLRFSIAFVWLFTGIVSLGIYPTEESYKLLNNVGITGALAPLMLYGAAIFDICLGVAILGMSRRRLLWLLQLGLIIFYTIVISWKMPEFWLHPYGPLLKNIPMIALIWALMTLEQKHGIHSR
ncbi:MAG: SDR family oxidoreductase [Nitrosomonadales bacterium]|nr:SDR family oxidoreductase [Nitrosomonadales bacterium]